MITDKCIVSTLLTRNFLQNPHEEVIRNWQFVYNAMFCSVLFKVVPEIPVLNSTEPNIAASCFVRLSN